MSIWVGSTYGNIYGEQNWHAYAASQQTDGNDELEEAHEKIAINRLVIEDVAVADMPEISDPSKHG